MPISFQVDFPGFRLRKKTELKDWIKSVIISEKQTPGTVNYIFCTDDHLLEINRKFLNHDTLTDIITFPHSSGEQARVDGDIMISVDRVRENAAKFKCSEETELRRVMVHGVLHLCGYKDKSKTQREEMRKMEDHYLKKIQ